MRIGESKSTTSGVTISGPSEHPSSIVRVALHSGVSSLSSRSSYCAACPDRHGRQSSSITWVLTRRLGNGRGWPGLPGWPNTLTADGRAEVTDLRHTEHLNSPHSVAVDADGNLYVSEWLLGGRYTKFALRD